MDKLILSNIRCFHERHEIPIAPLTFLIGENSTGKSTILSAIRLAWDLGKGDRELDFNEDPFDWGAYDQIAHFRGGRGGRSKKFVLGFESSFILDSDNRNIFKVKIEGEFIQKGVQPQIVEWNLISDKYKMFADFSREQEALIKIGKNGKSQEIRIGGPGFKTIPLNFIIFGPPGIGIFSDTEKGELQKLYFNMIQDSRPYAIAPIRTKPRRTYDRRRETPQPEGEHIPMILAGISSQQKKWSELKKYLEDFGGQTGLFKNVNIKQLGAESDPFQVQIQIEGPTVNLMDVGYGISQVLPIVVDCLLCQPGQIILMQQPEVHLHPKAQSELGSFLAHLVKQRNTRFIIETHSDYLIDRIRMDVRDGKNLKPEDIIILYCEREGIEVKVHPIKIDANGNLLDVPHGYRRFFLEEEKRLIGV